MYQFTPIISGFAFVGNTEKYVSAASVNSVIDFNDRKILSLREGGKFSYYCEYEHELLINGEKAIADRRNGLYSFSYESVEKITIEIYIIKFYSCLQNFILYNTITILTCVGVYFCGKYN